MFDSLVSPTKKSILLNTSAQLAGRVIGSATTLVITILVARQFGSTQFGDFVKITTYVSLFYLVSDFGLNAIFLQLPEKTYWPTLLGVRLAATTGCIALSLAALYALPGSSTQGYTPMVRMGILLLSPTIVFQGMITSANAIFQRRLRYDRSTLAILLGSIVTLAALFFTLFTLTAPHMLWAVAAIGLGALVTASVSLVFAYQFVGKTVLVFTADRIKRLIFPAVPLGITLVLNLVYFKADSIILAIYRPTMEVGIYGLAYKVFELALVIPTFFMNAVYPLLLRAQNIRRVFRQSFFFLSILSVFVAGALWVFAPFVTLVKSDFAQSIFALRVLSLSIPLFFITSLTMWVLIALKNQRILLGIYGASVVINIIGNVMFVPQFGFIAAAWMTAVGEGIVLALSLLAIRKRL